MKTLPIFDSARPTATWARRLPLPPFVLTFLLAIPSTAQSSLPTARPAARPGVERAVASDSLRSAVAPAPRLGGRPLLDPRIMHYATARDGGLWARGAHYKMGFDSSGATYFPAFGRAEPHDLPHLLSPDRVTLGGESLSFEQAATAVRTGDQVRMDRGTFVESYDLTPDSVEQAFVFQTLPRGGELVLHIPIGSELEQCTSADGLEFRGERGSVKYGRASAIDARGRRTPAATELENGAITIRVDADFLSSADLPVVIDPVVSTFPIDATANDNYWADSAYDAWGHMWFVVYEEWFSATDRDCAYEILDDNGVGAPRVYLDLTTDSWDSVHCANNAQTQQFLVVASVTPSPAHGGPVYVLGTTVYTNGWIGSQTNITAQEPSTIRNCVVGGDPYIGGPSFYCVVYEREYAPSNWDLVARLVRPDGSLLGSGPTWTSGGWADVGPAISKSNGTHDWLIAWQADIAYPNSDIYGQIMHWDGGLPNFQHLISSGYQVPQWQVAVSSPLNASGRYLATWQQTFANGDHDIMMALVDSDGTVLDNEDLNRMEGQNYLNDQQDSSVDSDGDHFLVSYEEAWGSWDLYASDVYAAGGTLGLAEAHVPVDVDWTADLNPRVTSCFSGGATDPARKRRYLLAWNSTPQGGGPADVAGAFFDTIPGGSTVSTCFGDGSGWSCPCQNWGGTGHGCANSANPAGALLSATGVPSTSGDTLVLQASDMPTTVLCVFLQGSLDGGGHLYGDGVRCVNAPLLRIGVKVASGGMASYPGPGDLSVSSRGFVPPIGGGRGYQVWYRDTSATFCPPPAGSNFNISNGVLVNWAP